MRSPQKKDETMNNKDTALSVPQTVTQLHHQAVRATDTHPELPIDPDVVRPGTYKWPIHFTPMLIGVVFVGGCIGALARYWATNEIPVSTNGWPTNTFVINLLGAFLLGILLEGLSRIGHDGGGLRLLRLGLGTGFLGAFTTYSTFAVEANMLFRETSSTLAFSYVAATIFGGLTMSALGIQLAIAHHSRRKSR